MKRHLVPVAMVLLVVCSCEKQPAVPSAPEQPVVEEKPAMPVADFSRVWGSDLLSPLELEALIDVLDTASREGTGLDRKLADLLLERLGGGIPKSMSLVSWRHFFNSALNALAVTPNVGSDRLAPILLSVMEGDSDKVMRLYALQHLVVHQPRTSEPLRGEIGRKVAALAYEEDDEISGTALMALEEWNGVLDAEGTEVPHEQRAVAGIISDGSRAADVRVSAVHAAVDGGYREALPAARTIAADSAQDMMLRKSAIHLIGRLGDANDTALLERCVAEHSRLAQAATPALERLAGRLEGRGEPELIPYR